MLRTTDVAHMILSRCVKPGSIAVDATVGNGHDALLLSDLVGETGHVYGFDVQQQALDATRLRLAGRANVTLLHAGHEEMAARLPQDIHGRLSAVIFNLGYLPGAAREIATRTETSLAALDASLALVAPGGLVLLSLYPGHPGGAEETLAVLAKTTGLAPPYAASRYARLNAEGAAPELLVIERVS